MPRICILFWLSSLARVGHSWQQQAKLRDTEALSDSTGSRTQPSLLELLGLQGDASSELAKLEAGPVTAFRPASSLSVPRPWAHGGGSLSRRDALSGGAAAAAAALLAFRSEPSAAYIDFTLGLFNDKVQDAYTRISVEMFNTRKQIKEVKNTKRKRKKMKVDPNDDIAIFRFVDFVIKPLLEDFLVVNATLPPDAIPPMIDDVTKSIEVVKQAVRDRDCDAQIQGLQQIDKDLQVVVELGSSQYEMATSGAKLPQGFSYPKWLFKYADPVGDIDPRERDPSISIRPAGGYSAMGR